MSNPKLNPERRRPAAASIKRHTKKAAPKAIKHPANPFGSMYEKYFFAPTGGTPNAFRILDVTDGSGVSFTLHT